MQPSTVGSPRTGECLVLRASRPDPGEDETRMGTMPDLLRLGVDQFLGRFSGPLNFRLMVMPTVVTIIALRAVWKDLRDGRPAFLGIWIQDPVERKRIFHGWLKDVGRIFSSPSFSTSRTSCSSSAGSTPEWCWSWPSSVPSCRTSSSAGRYTSSPPSFSASPAAATISNPTERGDQMKLKTGMVPCADLRNQHPRPSLPRHGGLCRHRQDCRGPTSIRRHRLPVDPEAYKKIDPKKLADELEVDMCVVNSGRFWMMDEIKFARRRNGQNFHGVDCAGAAT